LSIHNLKLHGIGYITVANITAVPINTAHQKLDLIACSVSQILSMVDAFFPIMQHNSVKDIPPFNKSKIYTYHLTFSFTLVIGHHLHFGWQIFPKLRAGKHSADNTMI
jgi:hypothetical protein